MKIAAISITYNDDYKFEEWYGHYSEHKDKIYKHIIVDNHSDPAYLKKVKDRFRASIIIERETNGGCTGAYNDGIRCALQNPEVDAIMLLGNDIKITPQSFDILYDYLFSDPKLGMVAPVLLEKDSDIVADFGCEISKALIMIPKDIGKKLSELKNKINYCSALTGGMNLAKREFYESVGLQDEKLFMYSDEVDMGIRAQKKGFKMACVRDAISWHQHINNPKRKLDRRELFTNYLGGRNKIYLANKHYGKLRAIYVFLFFVIGAIYKILNCLVNRKSGYIKDYLWLVWGAINGLFGNMEPNRFSVPFSMRK